MENICDGLINVTAGVQVDTMFAPFFLLLLAGFEGGDARCDHNNINKFGAAGEGYNGFSYKMGGWIPMSPEKRAVRSNIVFKGLLTNRHASPRRYPGNDEDGEFVGEFWVLDVYKGAEKLGAQMGVMAGGQGGVFGLKDQ